METPPKHDTQTTRIVTLDFNGGSHVYRNPELRMNIPVRIAPSGISAERARMLAETLNREYADSSVQFEVGVNSSETTSTVRIGRTSDFDRYGAFLGLAEGIGSGDAYVLLDDSANDTELVDVIRHEAGHLLGTLDHGGTGLARYAYTHTKEYHLGKIFGHSSEYLGRVTTVNVTIREVTPPSDAEHLTLRYDEDHTAITKRYYAWYKDHDPTVHITENNVGERYINASGLTLKTLSIQGGNATGCTADEITVSGLDTYDMVDQIWYGTTYSNVKSHRGTATGCTTANLTVNYNAIASNCAVNGKLTVMYNSEYDGGHYNPVAQNCTINGTLTVRYGGHANNNIIKSGKAVVGGGYEDTIKYYGTAVVSDLIVEDGDVEVYNGGELHNATINGCLTAGAGAKLSGTITCKGVQITEGCVPQTNITIKVNLRDYAVANYTDRTWNDRDQVTRMVEYFANYTTRTTDYTYVYNPDGSVKDVSLTVSYGTFDVNDERLGLRVYQVKDWKYTFYANFGFVNELAALGKVVVDFGGSEKEFDGGTIQLGMGKYTGSGIPFQWQSKEEQWSFSTGSSWNSTPTAYFTYNADLFGEAMDVLWLENGWDAETTYTVDLSPMMQGATENLTITDKADGEEVLTTATIQGTELLIKGGAYTAELTVKAEDSDKRDHACDLELIVVPEEIPVVGKLGAKKYSEMLKKAQKEHITKITDVFPFSVETEIFGMKFSLSGMSVTLTVNWSKPSMELKLQGKMELEIVKGKKLTIDLSDDKYISITHEGGSFGWNIVGELKVPDFKIGKFEFSDMFLSVNKGDSTFGVGCYVKLPSLSYKFGGSISIVGGYLDSVTIGVGNLNVPLGATGLMLQSISGSIEGISTSLDMTFGGNMEFTYGPKIDIKWDCDWLGIEDGEYSLLEIDVGATISTSGELTGSAGISSLGGFITGAGGVVASEGYFSVNGTFSLLNGCISIEGGLHSSGGNVVISGTGTMTVPDYKYFGPLAGMGLSVNCRADFGSRYVVAWEDMVIFGNQYSVGVRSSFDGDVELLGFSDLLGGDKFTKRELKRQRTFSVDGDSVADALRGPAPSASDKCIVSDYGITLFQCNFTVTGTYMSLSYDGTEYTQEAISSGLYADMQFVNELTTPNCITIAVNNAYLGEWTVNAYGDENATFGAYAFAGIVSKPTVNAVELGADQRSATICYALSDLTGVENATVSVFRAAGDATGQTGALLAEFSAADATGAFDYAPTDDLPGGSYAFYLMVSGDNYAPTYSALSAAVDFITIDTEAPDQIQKVSAEWHSTGSTLTWDAPYDDTGVAGYKVSYRASEEEDWSEANVKTASFTFDGVPNGVYTFRIAAYDETGNLAAWSVEDSVLVLTAANAKYSNAALTENIELSTYESAVGLQNGDFSIVAAADSLISGGTLADAKIGGIVENASVTGTVALSEGGSAYNTAVTGKFTVSGKADGVTVAKGGVLTVEADGFVKNVTVASGGSLMLMQDAEFGDISMDYGSTLTIVGDKSGRYLLGGDIRTAGTLGTSRNISANGHKIRFEQYRQTEELYTNDRGEISDNVAFLPDITKLFSKVLEIEIDSSVYGAFRIADKAGDFNGTITVIDHTDGSSAEVGLDSYSLVGGALCRLRKGVVENGLFLETVRSEMDSPSIRQEGAEKDTYDKIYLTSLPAANAGMVKKHTFRYSLNEDMSDAVTIDSDEAKIILNKSELIADATYYVQTSVENSCGVKSLWSDAASFTVTAKVLPAAPTTLTVSGATSAESNRITFTAGEVDTSNTALREWRFRYADNPEMENAVDLPSTGQRLINYLSIDKSAIEDGKDYYVQAAMMIGIDWSYWSDTVVFNTQGWDYDGITVNADGDYAYLTLGGKRARNITVVEKGYFYGGTGLVDGLTIEDGGFFRDDGATVTNAVVNGGRYWVDSGNVTDLVANSGEVRLMNGTLNGATIGVNASMEIDSESKGSVKGTILIQGNMDVYYNHPGFSTNASYIFDLGAHEADKNRMFINYTSPLLGTRTFTAQLDVTPETGDYRLAYTPNSGEFYVRLTDADGSEIGMMSLGGDPIAYNGLYYSLVEQDPAVYLHVSASDAPVFIGKVKLARNGTPYTSADGYTDLVVASSAECDYALVDEGGQLLSVTIGDGGAADVYGMVRGATVENGGQLTIKEGGCALSDIITIEKGGNVTIEGGKVDLGAAFHLAGGTITINGVLHGWEDDSGEWAPSNHWFAFDLDRMIEAPSDVMISDYEMLTQCNAKFTSTVSTKQAKGEYKLIGNAANFSGSLSISYAGNDDWQEYLAVGTECEINGIRYALSLKKDVLTLTVGDNNENNSPLNADGTLNPEAEITGTTLEQFGETNIVMDEEGSVEQDDGSGGHYSNSLGGSNKADYAQIKLDSAAKLSFTVKSDSKVKLTFYQLVEKSNKPDTYTKKPLKTVSVSGGMKSTASVLVEGGDDKLYYVAVENKNKKNQTAYYNVSLNTDEGKNKSEFFADGDDGWNNGPLLVKVGKDKVANTAQIAKFQTVNIAESGTKDVQFDTNEILADGTGRWNNFVGFGDDNDYVKLSATQPVELSLTINAIGNVKLIVYSLSLNAKGQWVQKTLQTTPLSLKKNQETGEAPSKKKLLLDRLADATGKDTNNVTGYYVSVQSTNASKGGSASYNVTATATVYSDADLGKNNFDSKTKTVKDVVKDNAVTLTAGEKLQLDGVLGGDDVAIDDHGDYTNFVGTGDVSDIVRIDAVAGTKVSLKVTATDAVSLVVYGLQKNGTLKALKTVKSKNNVAELNDFELKAKSAPGGEFFLGVTSTNAKKGSAAFYNVDVINVSGQDTVPLAASVADALSMPETDNLGISDALSFGNYGADALAGASASALAELDDKSAWQNLTLA